MRRSTFNIKSKSTVSDQDKGQGQGPEINLGELCLRKNDAKLLETFLELRNPLFDEQLGEIKGR